MILKLHNQTVIKASACLFDLDGTLVESTGGISEILARWAQTIGVEPQIVLDFSHGKRTIDIVRAFVQPEHVQHYYDDLTQQFIDSADQTIAIEGAQQFLNHLIKHDLPWIVVSSSERILIEARLKAAGLPVPMQFVAAEDVEKGKPSPEGYLLAAQKLGVDIRECVVFEDSEAGVLAAERANAQIVVIGSLEKKVNKIIDYSHISIAEI